MQNEQDKAGPELAERDLKITIEEIINPDSPKLTRTRHQTWHVEGVPEFIDQFKHSLIRDLFNLFDGWEACQDLSIRALKVPEEERLDYQDILREEQKAKTNKQTLDQLGEYQTDEAIEKEYQNKKPK